jgi:endoglucanase
MTTHLRRAATAGIATTALLLASAATATASGPGDVLEPGAPLYLDMWSSRVEAAAGLTGQDRTNALLLAQFPAATWLEHGTPDEVAAQASRVVQQAEVLGEVPVLVVYNIPFRDCAQYSAGGATSAEEYTAWIDGVAAGIGDSPAAVILEPDGLGIIPWYTNIDGNLEWCQPAEADPATAADERFAMLNHAVDALGALPSTAVYLDATHNGWLNVGDASDRLAKAGVDRAAGFFLNVSNYHWTANLEQYGTWISQCLAGFAGDYGSCPNQYWNGGPEGTAIADLIGAWNGVGLSSAGVWSDTATDPALNTSGINARYAGIEGEAHFVIDTSRNGQGPWTPPEGVYPDAQDWCNPPGRGLGARPTTDTGTPLVDAYLWVKIPGESDGECTRGLGPSGTVDPEWGVVDPGAGDWFAEQAAELLALADPPVAAPTCEVEYTVHGSWPQGFNTQVWLKNTGTTPTSGWDIRFAFEGEQSLDNHWSSALRQVGSVVLGQNLSWNARIDPGQRTTFGFIGATPDGPGAEPLLFLVDGAACTVR